jgi:hypothetical protein
MRRVGSTGHAMPVVFHAIGCLGCSAVDMNLEATGRHSETKVETSRRVYPRLPKLNRARHELNVHQPAQYYTKVPSPHDIMPASQPTCKNHNAPCLPLFVSG